MSFKIFFSKVSARAVAESVIVGADGAERLDQSRFSGLPRASDDCHGQNLEGRFEISDEPSRAQAVHGVK